jgi:hypothetical protein
MLYLSLIDKSRFGWGPSGLKFFHNYVLTNTGLGRAPVEWNPPTWLEGTEFGRVLGWIVSLG